jgi:hypothetical protein
VEHQVGQAEQLPTISGRDQTDHSVGLPDQPVERVSGGRLRHVGPIEVHVPLPQSAPGFEIGAFHGADHAERVGPNVPFVSGVSCRDGSRRAAEFAA